MAGMQHLNGLDLNLFVAFQALYRERSVTRAAQALGLTQPAMSHKLRRLRDALQDPLFVATPRGLLPTSGADAIAPHVHSALKSLQGALGASHFDPATAERHFILQMNDFAELTVLPKALELFRAAGPGLSLEVVPPGPDVAEALERGTFDLGFGAGLALPATARTTRLMLDDFVVLAREGHPATQDGIDLATYLAAEHVVVAPRGGKGTFVDAALKAAGHTRTITCRIRRFVTAPFLVADSDMFFTSPRTLYEALRERLPVVAFEPPFALPSVSVMMFWHERVHQDPGHVWLRSCALNLRGPSIPRRWPDADSTG